MGEKTCGSKFPGSGLNPWCGVTLGDSFILLSAGKNENNNNFPVFFFLNNKWLEGLVYSVHIQRRRVCKLSITNAILKN